MAVMQWNSVFVALCYKYTVSDVMPDMLEMLECLLEENDGRLRVSWPCSEFNATWRMCTGRMMIYSEWETATGNTERILTRTQQTRSFQNRICSRMEGIAGKAIGCNTSLWLCRVRGFRPWQISSDTRQD